MKHFIISYRTPLHWAAHRNHKDIVQLLLRKGADKWKVTHKGEAPYAVAKNKELQVLLGGNPTEVTQDLPITPNYLKYPTVLDRGDLGMKNNFSSLDGKFGQGVRIDSYNLSLKFFFRIGIKS